MYVLKFRKSRSKSFKDALSFAKRFGATFDGQEVTLRLDNVYNIYPMLRPLFGFIQNWKGTRATWNGKDVHPYRFILTTSKVLECSRTSKRKERCVSGLGCALLTSISADEHGFFMPTQKHWINFGEWIGHRWVIDKFAIYETLIAEAEEKAITQCPFFNRTRIYEKVKQLPDYLLAGDRFEVVYEEVDLGDSLLRIPHNIRFTAKKSTCGKG